MNSIRNSAHKANRHASPYVEGESTVERESTTHFVRSLGGLTTLAMAINSEMIGNRFLERKRQRGWHHVVGWRNTMQETLNAPSALPPG